MDREQVAEVLVNIATLLELKGENPFKTRAYLNAARALERMGWQPADETELARHQAALQFEPMSP